MSIAKLTDIISKMQEGLTGYMTQIDSDHSYIHEGLGFVSLGSTTIASGGTYKLHFKTPDINNNDTAKTKQNYIHWRPAAIIGTAGGLTWALYEGSSSISGGSAGTSVNLNRNSTKLTRMQTITNGVTVGADGTSIQIAGSGTAGNPARAEGGESGSGLERVLKPNTDYTLTITNLLAANNLTLWELFWYEEEKGNGH